MSPKLRDRPTPDLVVLGLTFLVAILIIGSSIGFIVLEILGAPVDLDKLALRLAELTNTLIGAIVGYLAGRGVSDKEKVEE